MSYSIEQLEAMSNPQDGMFTYEKNSNYDTARQAKTVGHVVRFTPAEKDLGGGKRSMRMSFPVCAATDWISDPKDTMEMVALALNAMPVLATELIAARKRIAELEGDMDLIDSMVSFEINPSSYDHVQVCNMNDKFCEIGGIASAALAPKGGEA